MNELVMEQARKAKKASRKLAALSTDTKNRALLAMADAVIARQDEIITANCLDLTAGKERGLSGALLDRLALNEKRIAAMAEGLRQIAALPDPVGKIMDGTRRPNGLEIQRVRVPFGVIGIIYESRPNVTADAAGLCIKSGNAVILRGGSEAIHSNTKLAKILSSVGEQEGLPENSVQLIESTDREAALTLMQAEGLVDLLMPRGGESLKKTVLANAKMPVLTSLGGNCHTYVDDTADLTMAEEISFNAKVSRPSTCNAMETLLVHSSKAADLLPKLLTRLADAGVEIRGCERTRELYPAAVPATEEDWETEYLAMILAVKLVDSIDEAMDHIAQFGSSHSETIVTESYAASERFTQEVDSACVYVNASTRFTDGFEFGLGAEVGISTQKLHARGPIGLTELTTYKSIIRGNGQIRV